MRRANRRRSVECRATRWRHVHEEKSLTRRRAPEHANHERWLVSYADFITLLFAFFVVMYALSMENLSKVKAAAESIRKAFGGPAQIAHGAGDLRGETQVSPFEVPADPTGDLHK